MYVFVQIMSFFVGHHAILHGLESRVELNGQHVTLLAWMEDGEQWQVELVNHGEVLVVDQRNLRPVHISSVMSQYNLIHPGCI